jgi:hypothetical protein
MRNVVVAGYARSPFHLAGKARLRASARTIWLLRSSAA